MRGSQIIVVLFAALFSVAIGNTAANRIGGANGVDGIIRLCEAGIAEDLIVAAAKQQPANLSVEEMLAVKAACKSDAVIRALMQLATATTSVLPAAAPVETLNSISQADFYLLINDVDGSKAKIRPVKLLRTGFKGGFSGLGSLMRAAPKMMAEIEGDRAEVRTNRRPEFLGDAATTYQLVRLEQKGDKRRVVVGSAGLMSLRSGFEKKCLVSFSWVQQGVDRIRIIPDQDLEPGEYFFFPDDGLDHVFPFGVD